MSTVWLNELSSANLLRKTYINGFLDISGGDMNVRSGNFFTGGLITQNTDSANITAPSYSMFSVTDLSYMFASITQPMTTFAQDITTNGNTIVKKNLFVINDASLSGKFTLFGDASLNSKLSVASDASLNSRLFLGGDASLNSKLSVAGDVSMNGKLFLNGDASMNSKLSVGGDVSMNGKLFLGGDASMNSKLSVGGDVSMNGKLFLNGDASMNSKLSVAGDVSMNGNVAISSIKSIYGGTISGITNDLNVYGLNVGAGDISSNSKLSVAGDVSFNSKLYVASDVSINGVISSSSILTNTLNVTGSTSLNSTLGVTGDTTLNGNISISSGKPITLTAGSGSNTYTIAGNVNDEFISPNSFAAKNYTWSTYSKQLGNIIWTVSGDTNVNDTAFPVSNIFDNTRFNSKSTLSSAKYNLTTPFAANQTTTATTVTNAIGGVTSVSGDWWQIQCSTSLVLDSYNIYDASSGTCNYPRTFYVLGSNDGTSWNAIQYSVVTSDLYTASGQLGIIKANTSGTQLGYITTTNNGTYTTTPYTYFRLAVTSVMGSGTGGIGAGAVSGNLEIGEWVLYFKPPTSTQTTITSKTGPTNAIMYIDPSNINQLDISGSLGIVNSNPSAMNVTPTSKAAINNTWVSNNITWTSSASSNSSINQASYNLFTGDISNNKIGDGTSNRWSSITANYNTTAPFLYNTTTYQTNIGGTVNANVAGEWLQIQSSVPVVMNNFSLAPAGATSVQSTEFPQRFYICGSNDGSTWTPMIDCSFSQLPFLAGKLFFTPSYTITNYILPTVQNSNASITGYSGALNPYTYFRMVVTNVTGTLKDSTGAAGSGTDGYLTFSKWNIGFTPTTSMVPIATDPTIPNELYVGASTLRIPGYIKSSFIGFNFTRTFANSATLSANTRITCDATGFNNTIFNTNGCMSTTGIFTAPIAGYYYFSYSILMPASGNTITIRKNATTSTSGIELGGTYTTTTTNISGTFNTIVDMYAGDSVSLWTGATSSLLIAFNPSNNFVGYLISAV